MRRRAHALTLVALSLLCSLTAAAVEKDFQAEIGVPTPARLVFSQQDLATCLLDAAARRCVLRASIKLGESAWRAQLAPTGGVAVRSAQHAPLTITAECLNCQGFSQQPHQELTLDFSNIVGAFLLEPGGRLRISNLHLEGFAPYPASSAAGLAYPTSGAVTLTPTFMFARNTTFVGVNISASYVNPSSVPDEDCERYITKSVSFYAQAYGPSNVTVLNATTIRLTGPLKVQTGISARNGASGQQAAQLGNATSVYKELTLMCQDKPTNTGTSSTVLAVAIAVPLAVVALAAGLLLLLLCCRERSRRSVGQVWAKAAPGSSSSSAGTAGAKLPPDAGADSHQLAPAWLEVGTQQHAVAAWQGSGSADDGWSLYRPSHSSTGVAAAPARASASSEPGIGSAGIGSSPARPSSLSPSVAHNSPHLASAGAAPGAAVQAHGVVSPFSQHSALHRHSTLGSSNAASRQHSISTADPPTPRVTPTQSLGLADCGTGGVRSGLAGRTQQAASDRRADTTSAVLKARSDAAVLKDLKLGPLLGQGCYGRVYKGRWKATPVAVKIIEHYSSNEGVGSSRGNRLSAGRELLFATSISHPNLVTTFHISTLSIAERSAAVRSLLPDCALNSHQPDMTGAHHDFSSRRASSSASSASSSGASGVQADMLETWIVMDYCQRGSLEAALKQGYMRTADGQPDMVGIYKALLDTASGLDYLHSIGVVHGDLKPANVLLKGSPKGVTCKITDFGLSRVLDTNASHISTGTHGTIVYMPKELLLSGRMTQATDIYSFGLMMWELFTSERVMSEEGLSVGQMFYMIAYQDWRPEVPPDCPSGYAELMAACWHDDPEQRPTAQQLLQRLQKLQGQGRQELAALRHAAQCAHSSADDTACDVPGSRDRKGQCACSQQGSGVEQHSLVPADVSCSIRGSSHDSWEGHAPACFEPYAQAVLHRAETLQQAAAAHRRSSHSGTEPPLSETAASTTAGVPPAAAAAVASGSFWCQAGCVSTAVEEEEQQQQQYAAALEQQLGWPHDEAATQRFLHTLQWASQQHGCAEAAAAAAAAAATAPEAAGCVEWAPVGSSSTVAAAAANLHSQLPFIPSHTFVGCLPVLPGLDDGGPGVATSLQPYLLALEQAEAARAAAGAAATAAAAFAAEQRVQQHRGGCV